ncbi:unnamed protein product, partial [Adineta ricciae]
MPFELTEVVPVSDSRSKTKSAENKSIFFMKHSLTERKQLHFRCRRVNDVMCVIALFGLILMIIDTECQFNQISEYSLIIIRPLISFSSLILVGLVIYYHLLNARLYAVNNHIADWRVTLKFRSIVIIICEMIVCAIHPFPQIFKVTTDSNNLAWLDMIFTLPMFFRLYLVARSVTQHSPLVDAASSRSIGYLNRVPMTISFILRAFLQTYPGLCWSCMMTTLLLITSWSLHACEQGMWFPIQTLSPAPLASVSFASSFANATWFTIVTFTTVGYGDIVLQTYCGRGIAFLTSFIGLFASAILVAVFINKISLNRSEQMVLDFVKRINQAREYRTRVMQIIQYSVRAWFLRRHKSNYGAAFPSLCRLHRAIQAAKYLKQQRRNVLNGNDSLLSILTNVYYEQKTNEKLLVKLKQQSNSFDDRLRRLEIKLDNVLTVLTRNNSIPQHSRFEYEYFPVSNVTDFENPPRGLVEFYYSMFTDIHVMMFIGFGFLMTFLSHYSYSAIGFNFILCAFTVEWAVIMRGFIFDWNDTKQKFIVDVRSLSTADFVSASILISMGAVLGQVSPLQLIIMAFFEVPLQVVNEWIGTYYFCANDAGESMFVHVFGAYFGLAVAFVLFHSNVIDSPLEKSRYTSDLFSIIGTMFLFCFWPSFNAGTASGVERLHAITNTYVSICASVIGAFLMSTVVRKGKLDMIHIQNSTLAGGVAVGTVATSNIGLHCAMIICTLAGM